MSRPVVGVDPSLTGTGIATDEDRGSIVTRPGSGSIRHQLTRIRLIVAEVVAQCPPSALVVIEAPAYAKGAMSQAHVRAGLWWALVDVLDARGCWVVEMTPTALKKFATGKGTATKPDMRMALYKRAGLDLADDNAVDAWWLHQAGRHLIGGADVVDLPKDQLAALGGLRGQLPTTG